MRIVHDIPGPGPARTSTVLAVSLLVMAGCVSPPTGERPGTEPAVAPVLLLLDTGPLDIPAGCEPARGMVYRTSFVVEPGGRIVEAASVSGEGCVQDALRQWVSTFEYRPVSAPTSAVLDWMAVTASRGG